MNNSTDLVPIKGICSVSIPYCFSHKSTVITPNITDNTVKNKSKDNMDIELLRIYAIRYETVIAVIKIVDSV